jgi:beta-lactamase regulating signal transducer with metallopeptidase domain
MLDRFFLQIYDMSKVAAIVILAVLLVRLCLRRAPKIFSYALWAVVLFRLLCPITIEAPLSLIPAVTPAAQEFTAPTTSTTPDSAVTADPDTIVPLQPLGGT